MERKRGKGKVLKRMGEEERRDEEGGRRRKGRIMKKLRKVEEVEKVKR
jgi:hypothetical protein